MASTIELVLCAGFGFGMPCKSSLSAFNELRHLSGDLDEVHSHGLADERERPGGAEITLDHHAVRALGDELHVERPRDVQLLRHRLGCVLRMVQWYNGESKERQV